MSACAGCLKRAALIGLLSPRIAELARRPADTVRTLLALPNEELARAIAPESAGRTLAALADLDPRDMRAHMAAVHVESVCRHEADYPRGLHDLGDAPSALFIRGDRGALDAIADTPAVAVVGGRRASSYALEEAHEIGRSLAVAGIPVVSGLALGVDGAAHRGTLAGGGRPVAVLASGADVPYPRSHRRLYAQVIEAGGAVISELPPGTTARAWAFPARNRIMAALARMVVVVEAAENSGTLITATFATQIGREVGAIPGRVNARVSEGSNRLIAEGAAVILGVEDVLDRLFYPGARPMKWRKVELEPVVASVLDRVEAGESPLAARDLDVKQVRAALGRLEVLGLVRRDGLGGYERTGVRCERA